MTGDRDAAPPCHLPWCARCTPARHRSQPRTVESRYGRHQWVRLTAELEQWGDRGVTVVVLAQATSDGLDGPPARIDLATAGELGAVLAALVAAGKPTRIPAARP